MSEREKFEAWWKILAPREAHRPSAQYGWQACAESMQAEIESIKAISAKAAENAFIETMEKVIAPKIESRDARIAQLEEALMPFMAIVSTTAGRIETEKLSFADWHNLIKAVTGSSDTWLAERIKEAEVKVLEEAADWFANMQGGYESANCIGIASELRAMAESRRAK